MKPIRLTTSDASGGVKTAQAIISYHGLSTIGLQVVVTGSVAYTIQQTLDNINDPTITPTWFDHPDTNLVAATASKQGNYAYPPAAIRISQASGAGSCVFTIIQAGITTGG